MTSADIDQHLARRIAAAVDALEPLVAATPEADFALPAARAVVDAGLHTVTLPPRPDGPGGLGTGLGAGLAASAEMLASVGAVDGSVGLGLAMHTQVVGGAIHSGAWPPRLLQRLLDAVAGGTLVNAASTEEGSGSPARGGLPSTMVREDATGLVLDGEKTWTTWLPALGLAVVSARLADDGATPDTPPSLLNVLVDLSAPGVERRPGFDALGMRGSASGRLRLTGVRAPSDAVVTRRVANAPDARGPLQAVWFGICVSAVYRGIGEGARRRVVRWAIDRRPGDGSTSVADLPTIQLRLGRLDAALRAARIVLLDVARRADQTPTDDRSALAAIASDVTLAKSAVTAAAVTATDEALRIAGGPGYLAGPLERAFRDARAGLINPPLEDVALGGFGRGLVERERAANA